MARNEVIYSKLPLLRIRTAEGISFSQVLAGPGTRLLSLAVDMLAIGAVNYVVTALLALLQVISADFAQGMLLIGQFVIPILYGILLEWFWNGQTLGKKLLRLRVVDADGLRLHFSQVAIRNLLRIVDSLPLLYAVGGISCLLTKKAQRIGDLAGNTVVIRVPQLAQPDLEQVGSIKYNSLRDHPHLEAKLRSSVSPVEAAVGVQALLRREEFDATARIELFAALADYYRKLVPYPPEVVEGVSDEQYVRNVVEILYKKKRTESHPSETRAG